MSVAVKSQGDHAEMAGFRPEILFAVLIADGVFTSLQAPDPETGADCVVTSGLEGDHSPRSRHYVGLAVDFRIRHLIIGKQIRAFELLKKRLGPEYFVKHEATHIHVQFNGSPR
jgi:hypothetical protein